MYFDEYYDENVFFKAEIVLSNFNFLLHLKSETHFFNANVALIDIK